jgi:ferredoxin
MEVEIDRAVCMGSGNCVFEAPGAFELDDDGIAVPVDPSAVSEERLIETARVCPTHAISVRRDGEKLV